MSRYKAIIAYDGTKYAGFQVQKNADNTLQGTIEAVLKRISGGKAITIHPSGRTDAGVHAKGQVIHFDFPYERAEEKLRFALDTQTPDDINFLAIEKVADDFHSRYLSKEKTYYYYVTTGPIRDPFKRLYSSHCHFEIDIDRIRQGATFIEGEHDFSVFCATGSAVQDKNRHVYEVRVEKISETELCFVFRGNGFLYKMVRMLVGTLLKIGGGNLPVNAIELALKNQDKKMTGPTANPEGLFLMNVSYD